MNDKSMKYKTVVKIKPAGYAASQGGTYGTVGYDPLNYKVSNPSGVQMVGGAGGLYRRGSMTGTGLGAEIIGSVGGVLGGLAGTYISGANPFVVAGASTAVGGVFKSIGEQIGLGVIPQRYIDFVDRLINNKKTFAQIKSAIMNFELSSDLKSKLSKAVSSLLRGGGYTKAKAVKQVKLTTRGRKPTTARDPSRSKMMERNRTMSGSGGVFQPQVSAYGLAKF